MKDCNYYSEEEDSKFSEIVIKFNSLRDGNRRKEALRQRILDRTQILLYQLPIRYLALSEDEAAEIYLASLENIDDVIAAYRVMNATYNTYLTTVCKYKALSISKRAIKNAEIEEGYNDDLICYKAYMEEDSCINVSEREPFYGEERPEIFSMNMQELVEYIATSLDGYSDIALTPDEKEMTKVMNDTKNRRRMAIYLLSLPQIESPKFIDSISRIMRLDTMVFSYFYALRFDLLSEINKRWEMERDKALRHFKTLLKLRSRLLYETDSLKIQKLNNTYRKINEYYKRKIEFARKLKRGLSQKEIANALGIKRSSVCYAIAHTKSIIQEIVGEI